MLPPSGGREYYCICGYRIATPMSASPHSVALWKCPIATLPPSGGREYSYICGYRIARPYRNALLRCCPLAAAGSITTSVGTAVRPHERVTP